MPMHRLFHRQPDHATMPFGDHLEELRRRLLHALVGLAPVFVVTTLLGRHLMEFLVAPVQDELRRRGLPATLIATSPPETFGAYLRIAIVVTVFVGAPWILLQVWRFVAPGLYAHERRFAYLLAPMSVLLTVASVAFLYFVMLPIILAFFIGFGSGIGVRTAATAPLPPGVVLPTIPVLAADPPEPAPGAAWINQTLHQLRIAAPEGEKRAVLSVPLSQDSAIQQQYRVSEYVKLFFNFALALGVGFQIPIVVLLLNWVGVLDRKTLTGHRRHALFVCAVLGAVLTPADPVSMLVLTVPLYLLYELGVGLTRFATAERVARGFGGSAGAGREPADAGDE